MKRVIITWSSKWLGYEIAKKFLQEWREVIGISRTKPNLEIEHISSDLTTESWIQHTIDKIKKDYPVFDCIIHNLWDGKATPLNTINFQEVDRTYKINTYAPLLLSAGLIDLIKENNADNIFIGATIGFKWYENFASYSSAKRALRWLIENLQVECKWSSSRVIGIHPWGMDTPWNTWPWGRIEQLTKITGKSWTWFMDPKDVADIVYYASSVPKNIELSEIIINRK